ncbi:hypothetical protein F751_5164 [Auxenochlorella protothecoides]|uniref:Uncharacterized protein n=1 Tax=Auxenochlorella protothecoides TaxID=3075 RepID=A0A087SQP9_AUXPR|nr:hypothetical protein F751_5164 [Auxenochlorella protothecoides]KFM28053.1 hypothetical protein F751_5164 [Auxenochlorella protothecoides]
MLHPPDDIWVVPSSSKLSSSRNRPPAVGEPALPLPWDPSRRCRGRCCLAGRPGRKRLRRRASPLPARRAAPTRGGP